MATTGKGSSSTTREKRGTSPSPSLVKKTPKPSTSNPTSSTSSPTKEAALTSSPTDLKPVPNYLKPTMSSNLDFSRLPKKSSTDSSAQAPAMRKRSFDRPPPASQVQKALRNNNTPGTREIKPTLRSSSFSHKSSTSTPKLASEKAYARTSSTVKESKVDPIMSKSRGLKKTALSSSITPVAKKSVKDATSMKKKGPKSVTSETSSVDHENSLTDQLVVEDDLASIDNEVQSLPEISEMPDINQELGDPTITFTNVEEKNIENVEDSVIVTEQENGHGDISTDIIDEPIKESVTEISEQKEDEKEEIQDSQTVEAQPEPENVLESIQEQNLKAEEQNPTVESDAVDEEEVEKKVEQKETESVEEKKVEEPVGDKETKLAEEKKVEETVEHKEAESETVEHKEAESETVEKDAKKDIKEAEIKSEKRGVTSNARGQNINTGKKDKEDYNDVIERTTSKLMGGRKNKVLAMAGAFETVISLDKK